MMSLGSTTQAYAVGHTHTDACYAGHRHTDDCLMSKKVDVIVAYYSSGYTGSIISNQIEIYFYCPTCKRLIWMFKPVGVYGRSGCAYLQMGNTNNFIDPAPGWSGSYGSMAEYFGYLSAMPNSSNQTLTKEYNGDSTKLEQLCASLYFYVRDSTEIMRSPDGTYRASSSDYTVDYYLKKGVQWDYPGELPLDVPIEGCRVCGKYSCGQEQDETPICDKVVTDITPLKSDQSIYYGETMDCTCTATYLDGHTGQVTCTATGLNNKSVGSQKVTLTYNGLVHTAKTTGSLSTTANVTIKDYVTGITAEKPSQTVIYNGSINTNAIITKASGTTETAACTATGYTPTLVGEQSVTLTYQILTTNQGSYPACTSKVTVQAGLVKIELDCIDQTVYKGTAPVLTATAYYMDNTTKRITPSTNYNPDVIGAQIIVFSFSDQGITKTARGRVTVLPNLTSLSVTASNTTVLYGTDITFTCTANYENGSSKTVTAYAANPYVKTTVGKQSVVYSYTENGITAKAAVSVEVLDYPISLSVTLQSSSIYQSQSISVKAASATLASGAVSSVTPTVGSYDNLSVGSKELHFSYSLNGKTVARTLNIQVLADLYALEVNADSFTIYRGQSLGITVKAKYNIAGEVTLKASEYTIQGFDHNVYNRNGSYYTVSCTNKGITVTKTIFIKVLPNIASMSASAALQTTEGVQVPFSVDITYEDGVVKTLTETVLKGGDENLIINDYDKNLVGYQSIQFSYTEGGKTLTQTVRIRVRAIIRVSIPISMLVSIDSNTGQVYASDISVNNQSKEGVVLSIIKIDRNSSNTLKDVPPGQYSNWNNLGKKESMNIAIGLSYSSSGWLDKKLSGPLYFAQVNNTETDIGRIDKNSTEKLGVTILHGNAFDSSRSFEYTIRWAVRLAD